MLTTHHQKTANHKDHLKESKNTLCIFQRCPLLSECQSPGSFNLAAASQSGQENHLTLICLGLFNYHSPHWRNCALQNPEHNREPATLQVTGEPSFFGFSLLEASGSNCSSWPLGLSHSACHVSAQATQQHHLLFLAHPFSGRRVSLPLCPEVHVAFCYTKAYLCYLHWGTP